MSAQRLVRATRQISFLGLATASAAFPRTPPPPSASTASSVITVTGKAEAPILFPVKVGDLYGYMDRSGKLVLKPQFVVGEVFREGLAQVWLPKKQGKEPFQPPYHVDRGFIDRTGKLLFKVNFPQNDAYNRAYLSPSVVGAFSFGRAAVEIHASDLTSKEGYIDTNGKLTIPASFDLAMPFAGGLAAVAKIGQDYAMNWGFIDPSGTYVIPSQFSHAESFAEGLAAVQDPTTKLWGYVDSNGAYALKPRFKRAWGFADGYAVVEIEAGRTFIDKAGNMHGDPVPALQTMSEGLAAFNVGGEGETYPGSPPSDDATGGLWGFRDAAGHVVIRAQYADTKPFKEGLAAANIGGKLKDGVVQGGRWGYIDMTGRWQVLPQFDGADSFVDGVAAVSTPGTGLMGMGGRDLYIDRSGNEIIPRNPNSPPPLATLAIAQRSARETNEEGKKALDLGDRGLALTFFTQAIQADPQFFNAYYNRASTYVGAFGGDRNCDAAVADLTQAIAIKPDLFQAYNNRGLCYLMMNKFQEALADFTKAIQLNRTDARFNVGRAQALTGLGRYSEAWTEVTKATQAGQAVPDSLIKILKQHGYAGSLSSSDQIQVIDDLAPYRPLDLATAHKTSGLFVGISNYPSQSKVQSTPAHTVGAALFQEIFYRAEANRQGLQIERSGLGRYASEYKPDPDEYLFKYNGQEYFEMVGASMGSQPQPGIPNLNLIADLRMDPHDNIIKPAGVVRVLAGIDGSWLQLRGHENAPVQLSPPGQLWPYFGRGRLIDRTLVLNSLDAALQRTTASMSDDTEFFVFYIAAHGKLDDHQMPYIITANDQLAEPEKLYYSEVLEHVGRLGTALPGKKLVKIIIFDTCQETETGSPTTIQSAPTMSLPADTILVTSTSPGHYALHLPSSIRESHSGSVTQGGASTSQSRVFDEAFSSTSSAFPLAAHAALQDAKKEDQVTVQQWLRGIQTSLSAILKRFVSADATQPITLHPDGGAPSPVLFKVVHRPEDHH